jgi:hypothetical protein
MTIDKNLATCIHFLQGIGITVSWQTIDEPTFLPGIAIRNGHLIIDEEKFRYPGDILHEAAHIAVVPAADRAELDEAAIGKRTDREAEEMMAIAWSYAVSVHLALDPYFVFHPDGYKGGGKDIADNFMEGRYFGVPMLQWTGMAASAAEIEAGAAPYPAMKTWLRI